MTWLERMATDETLRAFVQAEIVRAGIELDTARYNAEHWQHVAERLRAQFEDSQARLEQCEKVAEQLREQVADLQARLKQCDGIVPKAARR